MSSSTVLITGASGFVGVHLTRRLAAMGRDIRAVHHRPLTEGSPASDAAIEWVAADLTRSECEPLVRGIATVFHLAALSLFSDDPADIARMEKLNVDATLRLAAASKRAGVRQFIFVSSVAACEAAPVAEVDENSGQPVSAYGSSKRRAETALLSLCDKDFAVIVLRPSALFGEEHRGSVHELTRAIRRGRFALIGDGTNRVNFYYIGDFIDVLTAVEGKAAAFGNVFIAADEPQPLRDFVAAVASQVRPRDTIKSIPRSLGVIAGTLFDIVSSVTRRAMPLSGRRVAAMTRDVAYQNAKLAQLLGLHPTVGWRAGLRRTIEWYGKAGLL